MKILLAAAVIAMSAAAAERPVVVRDTAGGERLCASRTLPLFYARRNDQPAWSERDSAQLLLAIEHAGDDGLRPADYHLDAIRAARDPNDRELLFSDAFFLLASHLLAGRVDPKSIVPTWCLDARTYDLVSALETALENHTVGETLAQLAPHHAGYQRLRERLAALRGRQWNPIDAGRSLRRGAAGPRVEQLVARFAASGELTGSHATFDDAVDAAVRRFQHLHCLDADGVAGPRTLRELNVPAEARVRQLELNLERWRWLPATLGDRYAVINVPAFELRVVENERPVLSMRIVVGKDFSHQTPVFSSAIASVVFSPYWNVPPRIASRELWPKEARDPGYFRREHIEVVRGGALRQTPGPWNSLGLLKFNLPNPYDVYLHDTPARSLFDQTVRTFSHGCIRLEKPVDLAMYLLAWPRESIVQESQRGSERVVNVKTPLPVHVLYWTAYVEDDGDLHFAPDVYGRDAVLDDAMRKPLRPQPARRF